MVALLDNPSPAATRRLRRALRDAGYEVFTRSDRWTPQGWIRVTENSVQLPSRANGEDKAADLAELERLADLVVSLGLVAYNWLSVRPDASTLRVSYPTRAFFYAE